MVFNFGINSGKKRIDNSVKEKLSQKVSSDFELKMEALKSFLSEVVQNMNISTEKIIDLSIVSKNNLNLENIECPGGITIGDITQDARVDVTIVNEINDTFKIEINNQIKNSIMDKIQKTNGKDIISNVVDSNKELLNKFYSTSPIKPADSALAAAALQVTNILQDDPFIDTSEGGLKLSDPSPIIDSLRGTPSGQVALDFSSVKINDSRNRDIATSLGINLSDVINNTSNVANQIKQSLESNNKYNFKQYIESTNNVQLKQIICGGNIQIGDITQNSEIVGDIINYLKSDVDFQVDTDFFSKIDTVYQESFEKLQDEFTVLLKEYAPNGEIPEFRDFEDDVMSPSTLKSIIQEIYDYFNNRDAFIKYFYIIGRFLNAQTVGYSTYYSLFQENDTLKRNTENMLQELLFISKMFSILNITPESLFDGIKSDSRYLDRLIDNINIGSYSSLEEYHYNTVMNSLRDNNKFQSFINESLIDDNVKSDTGSNLLLYISIIIFMILLLFTVFYILFKKNFISF